MVRVSGGGHTGQAQVRAGGAVDGGGVCRLCSAAGRCHLGERLPPADAAHTPPPATARVARLQATRHGITRALQNWDPSLRPLLKAAGALVCRAWGAWARAAAAGWTHAMPATNHQLLR